MSSYSIHLIVFILCTYLLSVICTYKIRDEIIRGIWTGDNPLDYADSKFIDHGYPHTSLKPHIVETILKQMPTDFWLEVGSMIGNSAITTGKVLEKLNNNHTSIVCIDPFTGDVNMLMWEKKSKEKKEFQFTRNEKGRCTIYDRFRANIVEANLQNRVVPIQATGIVGMITLIRLHNEGRLSSLPGIIYLDSAHEIEETFFELRTAWQLLPSGGILLGDDWVWEAVQHDVLKFVAMMKNESQINIPITKKLVRHFRHAAYSDTTPVIVTDGQWIIVKS